MAEVFAPDIDYMRLAYIDRRDFVNKVRREDRLTDEQLEKEFDEWIRGIKARAWLDGWAKCCQSRHEDERHIFKPKNPFKLV